MDSDLGARRIPGKRRLKFLKTGDLLVVEADDDVVGLHASTLGGAAGAHRNHGNAGGLTGRGRGVLGRYAERRAVGLGDLAVLDQLTGDVLHGVAGDGETDAGG